MFNPVGWTAFLSSLWEQFGIFCITALAGLIVLIVKKKYIRFLFYAGIWVSIPIFHIVDVLELAGYSRFNLFLVPVILLSTFEFFSLFATKRKLFVLVPAAAALLAANFFLCPINIDGTKKPFWGNSLIDTSEHYYPYPQALAWIKENHNQEKILFYNLTYYYYLDFYFNKLRWNPEYDIAKEPFQGDQKQLQEILSSAKVQGYGVVVYHLQRSDSAQAIQQSLGVESRLISNQAHSLLVIIL